MRDRRFIAAHRGGQLSKEDHQLLMQWARRCSEHVLRLLEAPIDERLTDTLRIAKAWGNDNVATGTAMKASLQAHAVARTSSNPTLAAIARSIGQAAATAHMADHSVGAALYALKAVATAAEPVSDEQKWQANCLQELLPDMAALINATMLDKRKGLHLTI